MYICICIYIYIYIYIYYIYIYAYIYIYIICIFQSVYTISSISVRNNGHYSNFEDKYEHIVKRSSQCNQIQ